MLVRQLTVMAGPTGTAQPGELLDVSERFGKSLLGGGYAEPATEDDVEAERTKKENPEYKARRFADPAGVANKNGKRLNEAEIAERVADGRLVDLQEVQANAGAPAAEPKRETKTEPAAAGPKNRR